MQIARLRRKELDHDEFGHLWRRGPHLGHLGQGIQGGLVENIASRRGDEFVIQDFSLLVDSQLAQNGIVEVLRQISRMLVVLLNRAGEQIRIAGKSSPPLADRKKIT